MDRTIEATKAKLRSLGDPVCVGISGKSFPYSPLPGMQGVLREMARVEGALVWYRVFGERRKVVVFAVEPLR